MNTHNRYDHSDTRYVCPDKGGLLHKRSGPPETQTINTKADSLTWGLRTPPERPSTATPVYTMRRDRTMPVRGLGTLACQP
jgi:hypothetical protein